MITFDFRDRFHEASMSREIYVEYTKKFFEALMEDLNRPLNPQMPPMSPFKVSLLAELKKDIHILIILWSTAPTDWREKLTNEFFDIWKLAPEEELEKALKEWRSKFDGATVHIEMEENK